MFIVGLAVLLVLAGVCGLSAVWSVLLSQCNADSMAATVTSNLLFQWWWTMLRVSWMMMSVIWMMMNLRFYLMFWWRLQYYSSYWKRIESKLNINEPNFSDVFLILISRVTNPGYHGLQSDVLCSSLQSPWKPSQKSDMFCFGRSLALLLNFSYFRTTQGGWRIKRRKTLTSELIMFYIPHGRGALCSLTDTGQPLRKGLGIHPCVSASVISGPLTVTFPSASTTASLLKLTEVHK